MATETQPTVLAARGGSFLIEDRVPDEVFTPEDFSDEQRMIDGVHRLGAKTRLHICGNTRRILGGMGALGGAVHAYTTPGLSPRVPRSS